MKKEEYIIRRERKVGKGGGVCTEEVVVRNEEAIRGKSAGS